MEPRDLVKASVSAFNQADVEALTAFYSENAVNHQVTDSPVQGQKMVREMFTAEMVCIVENIFQDRDRAVLEWRDPKGLRGCGFFHVVDGKIVFQRGYWDKLSFLRQHGLPMPEAPN